MAMETIYLLLGSNLGDRKQNLALARQQISRELGPFITTSSIYKSSAWGNLEQPDFYNQVVALKSKMTPHKALEVIHTIENKLGRTRFSKWSTRTIDIDILFWGERIIDDSILTIPHPLLQERKFALLPLNEVAASFIHPVNNMRISDLLKSCTDPLSVEQLDEVTD